MFGFESFGLVDSFKNKSRFVMKNFRSLEKLLVPPAALPRRLSLAYVSYRNHQLREQALNFYKLFSLAMLIGLVSPFVIVPGMARILGFQATLVGAGGALALVIIVEAFGIALLWIGVWSSFLIGDLLFSNLSESVVSRIVERSRLVQQGLQIT
jgi:Zn-dependent protease with chaperone function